MTIAPTPPRLAERLLRRSLPEAEQPAVLGDLQEEFTSIAELDGPQAATRWYWRQVITSVGPNLTRQLRQGYQTDDARTKREGLRGLAGLFAFMSVYFALAGEFMTPGGWLAGAFPLSVALTLFIRSLGSMSGPRRRLSRVDRFACLALLVGAGLASNFGHQRLAFAILTGVALWLLVPERLGLRGSGDRAKS